MIEILGFTTGATDKITQRPIIIKKGERGIISLMYHPAEEHDPNHYVDVFMNDGSVLREFSIMNIMGVQRGWPTMLPPGEYTVDQAFLDPQDDPKS